MIPMHFPYGNTNTAGQPLYGTAVCSNFGLNYNPYYAPFYPNSNGLLPIPIPPNERNNRLNIRENGPRIEKNILINPSQTLFPMPHKEKNGINTNDFLRFIEQKTKPIAGLNPFANEFSLAKHNQIITTNDEKSSSYKLIFDNLIEQSLQSIEAIKKASKTISVNHVSTQCYQSIDQINRSTQTNDDNDQDNLLEEYSSRTIKLINRLLENFKYLLLFSTENELYNQFKYMSNIGDELRYLIYVINQIITSNKSSVNRDNLFCNMIKDFSIQSSPIILGNEERTRRLISSTPVLSSRQIDPITMNRSKICLLCQKPVDDSNDTMHKLCRLLSSPPLDVSVDT